MLVCCHQLQAASTHSLTGRALVYSNTPGLHVLQAPAMHFGWCYLHHDALTRRACRGSACKEHFADGTDDIVLDRAHTGKTYVHLIIIMLPIKP
jgi:hypothetical protein